MKYAFILSIVSLVLYHDDLLTAAGAAGYLAGIFFLITYREKPTILAALLPLSSPSCTFPGTFPSKATCT